MERVRALGLALMAALALSGFAVSSASASSFLAHPPANFLGSQTNTHKFAVNAGVIECTVANVEGTAFFLKQLHLLFNVKYSGCKAFGVAAHISHALYLVSADLKVSIENDIIINVLAAGCQIEFTPAGNQNLDAVHYANEGAELRARFLVKGITYGSTGGICGAAGNNGTYNGEVKIKSTAVGGVIRWDKE